MWIKLRCRTIPLSGAIDLRTRDIEMNESHVFSGLSTQGYFSRDEIAANSSVRFIGCF